MMLMISLGFGLGVLAVVLADWAEKRKAQRPIVIVFGDAFSHGTPRQRAEAARASVDAVFQDSTLPAKDS